MALEKLIVISVLVAFAAAKVCMPEEVRYGIDLLSGSVETKTGKVYATQGQLEYYSSSKRQRTFSRNTISIPSGNITYSELVDYSGGPMKVVRYTIQDGKCTKNPPYFPGVDAFCLPEKAFKIASPYIGDKGQSMDVYVFGTENLNVRLALTPKTNIPIMEELMFQTNGYQMMQTLVYYNPKVGPIDPSLFEIPAICKHEDKAVPLV